MERFLPQASEQKKKRIGKCFTKCVTINLRSAAAAGYQMPRENTNTGACWLNTAISTCGELGSRRLLSLSPASQCIVTDMWEKGSFCVFVSAIPEAANPFQLLCSLSSHHHSRPPAVVARAAHVSLKAHRNNIAT